MAKALASHPRAIRELWQRAEGSLELTEGTIYPVLHRLDGCGVPGEPARYGSVSPHRRLHDITPAGEAELQRKDWSQFVIGRA